MKHSLSCTEWILLAGGPAMRDERSGLAAIVVLSAVAPFRTSRRCAKRSGSCRLGRPPRRRLCAAGIGFGRRSTRSGCLVGSPARAVDQEPDVRATHGSNRPRCFHVDRGRRRGWPARANPNDQSAGIAHGRGGWEYSSSCRNRGGLVGSKRGAVSAEADPDADLGAYS